jgi:endogenous inhibitor of DNA gyrase (YacG/DUF329 family)
MTQETTGKNEVKRKQRCPICGKPSVRPFTPFCSKRCADVDLGRWLKGVYAIPVSDAQDADESEGMDERQDGKD